jgi:uncharacterized protein (UPF0332 family)
MDSTELFLQAERLLENKNCSEVDFRSAISRAYYSLYHQCLKFLKDKYKNKLIECLEKKGIRTRQSEFDYILNKYRPNFHSIIPMVLIDVYYDHGKKFYYDYGMKFKALRDQRNQADYDMSLRFTYDEARDAVEQIKKLNKSINELCV